jgi:hypothetical protein
METELFWYSKHVSESVAALSVTLGRSILLRAFLHTLLTFRVEILVELNNC